MEKSGRKNSKLFSIVFYFKIARLALCFLTIERSSPKSPIGYFLLASGSRFSIESGIDGLGTKVNWPKIIGEGGLRSGEAIWRQLLL